MSDAQALRQALLRPQLHQGEGPDGRVHTLQDLAEACQGGEVAKVGGPVPGRTKGGD